MSPRRRSIILGRYRCVKATTAATLTCTIASCRVRSEPVAAGPFYFPTWWPWQHRSWSKHRSRSQSDFSHSLVTTLARRFLTIGGSVSCTCRFIHICSPDCGISINNERRTSVDDIRGEAVKIKDTKTGGQFYTDWLPTVVS